MNTPDPRPPSSARHRTTEPGTHRRTTVMVAIGGVVAAGVAVAVVAQVLSGTSAADVGDAARAVGQTSAATGPSSQPGFSQTIVPATPVARKEGPTAPGSVKARAAGSVLAARAERAARRHAAEVAARNPVRVASFNVLGASHTRGKHGRPGYADGVTRARQAVSLVDSLDLDVFGAQEFEPSQQQVFADRLPRYASFPGRTGSVIEGTNSIMWDTGRFKALRTESVGIPYFGGRTVQMPYVLLEDSVTGQQLWFANFHNPADVHGPAQRWRNSAIAIEADLATQLGADGTPVIMTGDFNDRADFFCPFTSQAPTMKSANSATNGSSCQVPRGTPVDWVLGSTAVSFDGYQALDGGVINRITDHPVIVAEARLAARP